MSLYDVSCVLVLVTAIERGGMPVLPSFLPYLDFNKCFILESF